MATCEPFISLHETIFIPMAAASALRTNIYRTKMIHRDDMGGLHEDILFNVHLALAAIAYVLTPHLTK